MKEEDSAVLEKHDSAQVFQNPELLKSSPI